MADQIVDSFDYGESVADIAYTFRLSKEQIRELLEFAGYRSELKLSA